MTTGAETPTTTAGQDPCWQRKADRWRGKIDGWSRMRDRWRGKGDLWSRMTDRWCGKADLWCAKRTCFLRNLVTVAMQACVLP